MGHPWSPTLALVLSLLAVGRVQGDCGLKNVAVETECEQDRRIACAGLHRALEFLSPFGITLPQPMRIQFAERPGDVYLAEMGVPLGDAPASGYYDAGADRAVVRSSRVPVAARPLAFGTLPMTDEMLTSTVTHEVVHHVYHHLCAGAGRVAEAPVSEYLAYVVQIETLREAERDQVLALWPKKTLPSREAINLFLWALDPPRFGVMAYRFHRLAPGLFRDVLSGRHVVADQSIPPQ